MSTGRAAAVLVALATVAAGCGGKTVTPSTTASNSPAVRLTADDLPDVLTSGIWPGAGLRAYRSDDSITVHTAWGDSGVTVDGRTTLEAAVAICSQVVNDLEMGPAALPAGTLQVQVLANNGWEH